MVWKINGDLRPVVKRGLFFLLKIGSLVWVLGLSACSQSSPPSQFYMLEAIAIEAPVEPVPHLSIALSPLQLPRYLNRTSIVSRVQPRVYDINSYHRWAEELSEMLNRIVPYNLQQLTQAEVISTRSSKLKRKADLQLKIQIFQFHVNESQEAVLTVRWQIQAPNGDTVNNTTQTYYKTAETDRTEDQIQALNETVNQMSRAIASQISRYPGGVDQVK